MWKSNYKTKHNDANKTNENDIHVESRMSMKIMMIKDCAPNRNWITIFASDLRSRLSQGCQV